MKYLVESDRLLLRNFELSDANVYHQMTRDPDIQLYVPSAYGDTPRETFRLVRDYNKLMDGINDFYLILEKKDSHELIGAIIATAITTSPLCLDMAIITHKNHRRCGYMYEALTRFREVLPKGTEMWFTIAEKNIASYSTVSKLPGATNLCLGDPEDQVGYHLCVIV